jgi:hypothetical protein
LNAGIKINVMKKIILCTLTSFLAFTFIPNEAKATAGLIKTELPNDSAALKNNLITRLGEINAMDRSSLNHNEKKALNKEVRAIDKNLHDNYGGVYISVGALLIIILLIIIFL